MKFMSEDESAALVSHEMAYEAAREALTAAASDAIIFPAVLAHGSAASNRFSIKSASTPDFAGLKVGSFWPGNSDRGLPRHNSVILLFDQSVGKVEWVVEAGKVNAYRTAAADAVAADVLARADASVLAIFGAGNQALFECLAIARIRSIRQILVVARDPAKGDAFVAALQAEGLEAARAEAREACERADIIVTATPSRAPLFDAGWVRPGTHVASMGSDAAGKQELPPELFDRASLFCDLPSQAVVMGDLQHFRGDGASIVAIGDVLLGRAAGPRLARADYRLRQLRHRGAGSYDRAAPGGGPGLRRSDPAVGDDDRATIRLADICRDGAAAFLRRGVAGEIAGAAGGGGEHLLDRAHDRGGGVRLAEMLEHHRRRPDLADRVGDALAGDVGRRAVDRLEQRRDRAIGVDVAARRDADRAGAGRAEIGEDVAEQVGGDDDVEAIGVHHELRGQDVDMIFVGAHVRIARRHRLDPPVPPRHGDGDAVGLGRRGQVLLRPRVWARSKA